MNTSTDNTRTPSEGAARSTPGTVEHLSTAECWELIEARSFGRLAVEALDGIPDVFPLNYTVHDGSLYIRSAPGSKLMAIVVHPVAAFEIDGEDDGFHWSVVLRGAVRRLVIDKEIRESGVQDLVSSSPTTKYNYICVTPATVSGRRFASSSGRTSESEDAAILKQPIGAQEPTRPYEETVEWPDPASPRVERPIAIAHFPPR
ncbi:pyridoxamine 5'-phosphate oxidase family protein [Microbacterium pumilum]|uniref:Pyridoxamine 5'-phosphate oxidase family protein n=1 Tax=Microbacterium pumilum TaxID=344165 RepID=A0ABP5EKY8_9MICO